MSVNPAFDPGKNPDGQIDNGLVTQAWECWQFLKSAPEIQVLARGQFCPKTTKIASLEWTLGLEGDSNDGRWWI